MAGATGALYAPLIERDLEAVPAAAQAFADEQGEEALWLAVARFAVLAYAPSQHSKRAVLSVRAAHELREVMAGRWLDLIVECALYSAESRPPWSEPPILEPPALEPGAAPGLEELRAAIAAKDRPRAERWIAARAADADDDLRRLARGDALLITDAVLALAPLLGEKGRYALLRLAVLEMLADDSEEQVPSSLDACIARAIEEQGSLDSVRDVLLWCAGHGSAPAAPAKPLDPYRLSRDYAQTLLAHAAVRGFPATADGEGFLRAVHHNLERGEGWEEWSFA